VMQTANQIHSWPPRQPAVVKGNKQHFQSCGPNYTTQNDLKAPQASFLSLSTLL
jgi:hypothetical protein